MNAKTLLETKKVEKLLGKPVIMIKDFRDTLLS